ncbi:DUF397 domain-containing protein [Nonomuraea sp. NPDC050536]|uniref:DUF397 domain-containing protein n=1 Tax=Nonomuraea sp. NPDC050536 TaxID=3364366 RepID=UPI0037C790A3
MIRWRKSSRSIGAGECVEVARLADGSIGVRHSRDQDGHVLVFTRREWAAFLDGVHGEEFELAQLDAD